MSSVYGIGSCASILELLNGCSHSHVFLFYVVAVIGFTQTAYTFEEADGTVEVCAAFLNPSQIAPDVVVELMGSTSPSTYPACCVNKCMYNKLLKIHLL